MKLGGARTPVQDLKAHFWSKTKLDSDTGCLLWTGSTGLNGYGRFFPRFLGRCYVAHRYAAYLAGFIPSLDLLEDRRRGCVLHSCRSRACVNPRHLYVGSIERNNGPDRRRDGTNFKGASTPAAKLSEEAALQVRVLCDEGVLTHSAIARALGLSPATIDKIAARKSWRHLPEVEAC